MSFKSFWLLLIVIVQLLPIQYLKLKLKLVTSEQIWFQTFYPITRLLNGTGMAEGHINDNLQNLYYNVGTNTEVSDTNTLKIHDNLDDQNHK